MTLKKLQLLAAACLLATAGTSQAGLVQMYNTNLCCSALDSVADAEAIIAASGGADFTTNVDYINFSGDSFPGADFGAPPNDRFVMRVTGTLDTTPFSRLRMDHDDGFVVRLNGVDFFGFNGNTAPTTTYSGALSGMGIVDFELIFWDQGGGQVAGFGGTVPSQNGDFYGFIGDPVAVPEPGVLSLLGAAWLAGSLTRRRKAA